VIVGGVTGGLFHVCEKVGLGFFTILIGLERAKHDSLRITRVWVGGLIVGLAVGLAIGVVDPFDWQFVLLYCYSGIRESTRLRSKSSSGLAGRIPATKRMGQAGGINLLSCN